MKYKVGDVVKMVGGETLSILQVDLYSELYRMSDEGLAKDSDIECKVEDMLGEVDHPPHYNQGIETIDYIESHNLNFNQGNIIKYVTRCEHKGNKLKDLKKAEFYIKREIGKCLE